MKSKLSYYYEMYRQLRPLRVAPKIWNYLKYRSLTRQAITPLRRYTPQICTLLLTKRCNLNCGYCNAAKILQESGGDDASLDKVKRIFANPLFANCLLVDLSGGEPLLISDLNSIIFYLAEQGRITNLITNGLLLADRIADLKRAGISRINISIYDANWPVIKRDLIKINRIFPVHVSLVLMRGQVEKEPDKFFETIRFIHGAGCRSLRFWLYRPMGVNPKAAEIISDTLPAYIGFRRRVEEVWPNFCLWPAAVKTAGVKKLCPQLWQRTGCDMSGNMIICCGIDTTLAGLNSNLFNSDPNAIFNNPTLVAMREKLLDSESDPPEVCQTCNLLGEPGW